MARKGRPPVIGDAFRMIWQSIMRQYAKEKGKYPDNAQPLLKAELKKVILASAMALLIPPDMYIISSTGLLL